MVRPPGAERELLLTVDVITPIVDDPRQFGMIAAFNALSDVYAMGGTPELALSFLGMPDELGLDVVSEIVAGTHAACAACDCAIVGGHSVRDTEPKVGLTVIGSVEPGKAWTHAGARPGDQLILSKALGTGLIAQAAKASATSDEAVEAMTTSMLTSNRAAAEAARAVTVSAATDVTGFGLLGHLAHILEESRVGARLHFAKVPRLPGALEAAAAAHIPGGSKRNLAHVSRMVRSAESLATAELALLADAQTSGGLLLCVAPEDVEALLDALPEPAACIGEIIADTEVIAIEE